jgi:hypothetical protein
VELPSSDEHRSSPQGGTNSLGGPPRRESPVNDLPPRFTSLLGGGVLTDATRRPDFLRQLDGWTEFWTAWADLLGIEPRLDHPFDCILPEHDGSGCKARLWLDKRGKVVYRCGGIPYGSADGAEKTRRSFALAEVFAAVVAGVTRPLRGSELARWKLRLMVSMGWLPLPEIDIPALTPRASEAAVRVHEGVLLLFRVRAIAEEPYTAAPLSRKFLARWCSVTEAMAEAGKSALIQHGIIERAGEQPIGARTMTLWRLAVPTL